MTLEEFIKQGDVKKAQPTTQSGSSASSSGASAIKLVAREGQDVGKPKKNAVMSFLEGMARNTINAGQDIAGAKLQETRDYRNLETSRQALGDTQRKVYERIREKQSRGEDASDLIRTLQESGGNVPSDFDINPTLNKTNLQIGADFAGLAADIVGFGSLPGAGRAVASAPSFLRGAGQGALTGLKYGSAFGGLRGVTSALQEGETDFGTVAGRGLTEGAIGGAFGAGVGGVLGGIGGAYGGYKAAKQQQVAKNPGAMTGYTRDATGTVIKDRVAKEAVKQGFEDVDVRFLRGASKGDQTAFQKMYQMRATQAADKTSRINAAEVPGKTMNDTVRYVYKQRQIAGQKIGETIKNMPKNPVDITDDIYTGFVDDLTEAKVKVRADGTLNFKASQFKGTPSVQKHIQQLYDDLRPNADGMVLRTPERIWTVRKSLFDALDLAKKSNELSTNADRILRKVYENLDNPLVAASDEYAGLAKTYAQTSGAIRNYNSLLGKEFELTDELVDLRAGEVGRRITGHAPARALAVVDEVEALAKELGYTTDQSIRNQLIFANDILEQPGVFKAAPGSLRGQSERAIGEAIDTGVDAARGNLSGLAVRGVKKGIDYARNINPEAKKAVLRQLIGLEDEAASTGTSLGQKLFSEATIPPVGGMSMKATGATAKQLSDSMIYNATLQSERTGRASLARALQGIDTSRIHSFKQLKDRVLSIPGARTDRGIQNWLKTTERLFVEFEAPIGIPNVSRGVSGTAQFKNIPTDDLATLSDYVYDVTRKGVPQDDITEEMTFAILERYGKKVAGKSPREIRAIIANLFKTPGIEQQLEILRR